MMLLVDAGNTRIKWRIVAERVLLASGSLPGAQVAELEAQWRSYGLTRAVLSCVASAAIQACLAEMLARLGVAAHWLHPERLNYGIHNLYDTPGQLGADRYAALIAAARLKLGHSVVVSVGTATTVDMLSMNHEFLGGVIIPGPDLMRAALLNGTGQIENRMRARDASPFHDAARAAPDLQAWPRDTDTAVAMGIGLAQAGAVQAVCERMPCTPDQPLWLILTGGARGALRDWLTIHPHGGAQVQLVEIEDLVLEGLAWVALELASLECGALEQSEQEGSNQA
ncbi:MAG: hypothetical protein B7Y41_11505 [Hydrogenophilales bacterium 28-61-23]|nr:MAG: hypothetical protein B7Y41_11505 [Hydrogenophilales bacterium 28-61-23]